MCGFSSEDQIMSQLIKAAIKAALVVTPTDGRDRKYIYSLAEKIGKAAMDDPNLGRSAAYRFGLQAIWSPSTADPKYWVARALYFAGRSVSMVASLLFEDGVRGYILKGYRFEMVESFEQGAVLWRKLAAPRTKFKVLKTVTVNATASTSDQICKEILDEAYKAIRKSDYYIGFNASHYPWFKFQEAYNSCLLDVSWLDKAIADKVKELGLNIKAPQVVPVTTIWDLKAKKLFDPETAAYKIQKFGDNHTRLSIEITRKFDSPLSEELIEALDDPDKKLKSYFETSYKGSELFYARMQAQRWPLYVSVSIWEINPMDIRISVNFQNHWYP